MAANGLLVYLWEIEWREVFKQWLTIGAIATIFVCCNVLRQKLFKDPSKPPVVLHWFPFIGSTVTYGIDPYKFYFDCQAKVSASSCRSKKGQS